MISIVCACDEKYAKNLGTMIYSVVYNSKQSQKIRFYIIDGGMSKKSKTKLAELLNVSKINYQFIIPAFNEEIRLLRIDRHISSAAYYRLFIPTLLSKEISKVIYLDSDIIAMEDIEELWNIDINKYSIGAKKEYPNIKRNEKLNLPESAPYFNSGVLLINLDIWRKRDFSRKIISYIQGNKVNLHYHDQDGINALLYNDSLEIPTEWNILSQDVYGKRFFGEPKLIHFTEASKPWQLLNNHPYKKEYKKYLAMTPWKDDIPPENAIIHKLLTDKRIIIFGSGGSGLRLLERVMELNGNVSYFLDNNKELSGKLLNGKKIYNPNKLADENFDEIFIIIASMYYVEIEKQLTELSLKRLKHFVSIGYENELLKEW